MLIRRANVKDLESIQNLNSKLFDLEYNNFDNSITLEWPLTLEGKEYFSNAIESQICFVAEDNSKVIGYLIGSITECSYISEKRAELDNMYIDINYRNLGIGNKLVNEFKNWCVNKNVKSIIVVASKQNEKAINFYKNNLFEEYNITLKCDL